MGGTSNLGSLLLGFATGSVLTAVAAYIVTARDLERLQKENKRLQDDSTLLSSEDLEASMRGRGLFSGSSSAVIASSSPGEQVGFLTDILKQLWGYIRVAGAASIKETVEPMFADMMPGPLKGLKFTKIDLGTVPIRMDNVVVHKVDHKNHTLQFDLDMVWDGVCFSAFLYHNHVAIQILNFILFSIIYIAGNCDIQLKAGSLIAFGCKSVKLRGRMSILMRPLTTDLSIVSGIQYTFINPPDLELDFTGLAQVADFRGVDTMIRKILQDILASMMVLPERMLYVIMCIVLR